MLSPLMIIALISSSISQTLHSNFNGYNTNAQYYLGLNNEFAELAPTAYEKFTSEQSKRIQALRHVIGHLPFFEQMALIDTIDSKPTTLFDKDLYLKKIRSPNSVIDFAIYPEKNYSLNIFEENSASISTYITESIKRLNKGLGCIKKVANKYGYDSSNDEKKVSAIYAAMNDIFKAQTQSNYCAANFLALLQNKMMQRRALLFTLKKTDINIDPENKPSLQQSSNFVYEDDDSMTSIIGMKYTVNETDEIVKGFKSYATCQHTYKNILSTKVMEIEMEIGQFKGCLDKGRPDVYVGNRTDPLYPSDEANNSLLIRPNRTVNNFYLNWGFKRGYGLFSEATQKYPGNFTAEFFDNLTKAIRAVEEFVDVNALIEAIQSDSNEYRLYANLHSFILNTIGIDNNQSKSNKLLAYLNTFETASLGKGTALSLFSCKQGEQCSCKTQPLCPPEQNFDSTLKDLTDQTDNFHFSKINIFIINQKDVPPILITQAEGPLTGKVFDIYHQGVGLGNLTMSITQSCFGAFTGGEKNGKDVCRDIVSENCGTDLDFNCKKSGLYDVINESPVSSNALPYSCALFENGANSCFKWIDRFFLLGTIAVKSSAFVSYHLHAQSSVIKDPPIEFKDHYKPAVISNIQELDIDTDFKALYEDTIRKNKLYVLASSPNSYGNNGLQVVETDKSNLQLQLLSSTHLHISGYVLIVITFFLLT